MVNRLTTFVATLFCLISCGKKSSAIYYNDKAVEIISSTFSSDNEESIKEILFYFDKAIEADKNYLTAYNNKFRFLNRLERYSDAIEVLNALLKLDIKKNQTYLYKGILLEKTGQLGQAQETYSLAEEHLKKEGITIDFALIKFLKYDSIGAIKFLDSLQSLNSKDSLGVNEFKKMIMEKNRQQILEIF